MGGVEPVVASFTPSATTAQTGEDITFTATSTASLYIWDLGDGNAATSPTATHQYQLEGTYMVKLTVMNSEGCQSSTTKTVTIQPPSATGIQPTVENNISIWSAGNRVYIDLGKQTSTATQIDIYNLIGQLLHSDQSVRSTMYSKEFRNSEAAYLIVKVTKNDVVTTKRVFVGQ